MSAPGFLLRSELLDQKQSVNENVSFWKSEATLMKLHLPGPDLLLLLPNWAAEVLCWEPSPPLELWDSG